jgi:hypothetical protein
VLVTDIADGVERAPGVVGSEVTPAGTVAVSAGDESEPQPAASNADAANTTIAAW